MEARKVPLELEFRLGRYVGTSGANRFEPGLSMVQFKNISDHLKQQIGHDLSLSEETTLDITIDNERLTIPRVEQIIAYCSSESLPKGSEAGLIYIEKLKEHAQTVDITDYNLRFQISSERPLEKRQIATFNEKLVSAEPKYYRYKHRYSFTSSVLRFDLTTVKSGEGTNFKTSKVLTKQEQYEVELEYLGNTQQLIDDDRTLSTLYNVAKWSQDSFAIITTRETEQVLDQYKKLTQVPDTRLFIGVNVLPLQKYHLEKMATEHYSVTEKADGERSLLFVTHDGTIYLINNRMDIKHTGFRTTAAEIHDSIFDGELVLTKDGYSHIFLIFDCFFLHHEDIRSKPLYHPEELEEPKDPKHIESRYGAVLLGANRLAVLVSLSKEINLQFQAKHYEFAIDKDSVIFALIKKVYRPEIYNYKLDGLIFTPYLLGYPVEGYDWKLLLKWKPIEQLSIDFMVEKVSDQIIYEDSGEGYLVIKLKLYDTYLKALVDFNPERPRNKEYLVRLRVGADGRARSLDGNIILNKSVVEFVYDQSQPIDFRWQPLRFRPDKTQKGIPNKVAVATSTWPLIISPITLEMMTGEAKLGPDVATKKTGAIEEDYYEKERQALGEIVKPMNNYHNMIKRLLIERTSAKRRPQESRDLAINLLDIACGQGGDLNKWDDCRIAYVLGLDYVDSNIAAAQARYDKQPYQTQIDWIWADSTRPINGLIEATQNAGRDLKNQQELQTILKKVGVNSFDVVSCQFAFHYFTKDQITLENVLKNVTQNLKEDGYFIGTTLDGATVYKALQTTPELSGMKKWKGKDVKIWGLTKKYTSTSFEKVGQEISAYNLKIGEYSEYLVNFDHLRETAKKFDLIPVTESEIPDAKGFQFFGQLRDTIASVYSFDVNKMSTEERKYSDMNRTFIFKKKTQKYVPTAVPIVPVSAPLRVERPPAQTIPAVAPVPPTIAPQVKQPVVPVVAPVAPVAPAESKAPAKARTRKLLRRYRPPPQLWFQS